MLQYLNEDDYDAKKQQEIGTLEQTIGLQKEVSYTCTSSEIVVSNWHFNVNLWSVLKFVDKMLFNSLSQHHEKDVGDKKKIVRDLKRTIQDKKDENNRVSVELEELNVSVNERRHINEVNGMLRKM